MTEAEFQEYLERSIPRLAARWVERGLWAESRATESSRAYYARMLPQGVQTPNHHLVRLVETKTGRVVGEAWYSVDPEGGKTRFCIEWIWIDPACRRQGHATEALRCLEEEARNLGAERTELTVWTDNPNAVALYAKLGYTTASLRMAKRVGGKDHTRR